MRWSARRIALVLLTILPPAQPASPSWGGEGFLNPNAKVNEAVPYGRDPFAAASPAPDERASPPGTPAPQPTKAAGDEREPPS